MSNRHERGMALVTALLVLLLISSMIVGMSWLVMTDQKLGGNNADRQNAFYGAEAGMEALTTTLSNSFDNNYALSAADINTIITNTGTAAANLPSIQFLNPDGTNGLAISFTKDPNPGNLNNPLATNHTILSGTYAGLVGLLTPYTLQVTSRTAAGSEARLQRTVQTVAIPVFQFGIFSDTDLSFFAGPNFDFGGRVHTNGNLWLAEGDGSTLTMRDKVTAAGELVRTNLENGWPLSTAYNGTISITQNPGSTNFGSLTQAQGSTTGTSWFGNIAGKQETLFQAVSATYNGNVGNVATGVKALDLTIATPAIGGTAIDMLRLPQPGELLANPGKLAERYYSQASLRIMLSDYGADGTCATSDLIGLDYASPNAPVDLAQLAWDSTSTKANGIGPVGKNPMAAWLVNQGVSVFPLPVSDAQNAAKYNSPDGYWVQQWFPIVTGCIKIDYQTKAGLVWVDVTQQILNLGFTGRNLNPQTKANMSIATNKVPNRYALPGAQIAASTCADPSPNAVIRLARVRDNPSSANNAGGCGAPYTTNGTDYTPNVLYDTREALLRDDVLAANATNPNGPLTLAGAMSYIELDVTNLNKWFTGVIAGSGASANNTTGYTVYFSDRRGDRKDPSPPKSVGVGALKTGAWGFDDIVNPGDNNSCPDGALAGAEDFESDFTMGSDLNPPAVPRTYDQYFPGDVAHVTANNPTIWTVSNALTPIVNPGVFIATTATSPIQPHPKCAGAAGNVGNAWPYATALNGGDLRLNPPVYFRRGLKIVNGGTLTLGTCDGVACGLTIVSENPAYVQGDYNAGANGNFATAFVAASVMGDAVTLLSNNWNDVNSFAFPYATGSRAAATTTYRMAIVGGKTIPFKQPGGGTIGQDFGTDGGVHNFLRYIENWGGQTLFYKGSIVALFYSHQAAGTFKCCNTVYSPPTRGYSFQTEFLTPSLLPPRTPMFRDINTIGFTQLILPTQ